MSFDPALIEPAVSRYRRERDRYLKLADRVEDICRTDICEASAIRAQVTSRVKTEKSFKGKLRRFSMSAEKNFACVDAIFEGIGDFAGVRIATYRNEDREAVVAAIQSAFCGPDGGEVLVDRKDKQSSDPTNFYQAIHVQVSLKEGDRVGIYDNLEDVSCEIQVCTMMAHVWNEIEHDIGYKPDGKPGDEERFLLRKLGETAREGDQTITRLLAEVSKRMESQEGPFRDVQDFVGRMAKAFEGIDFSRNAGQLYEVLTSLELTTPAAVRGAIWDDNGPSRARRTIEEFNAYLAAEDNGLQLDPMTSDLGLIILLGTRCDDVLNSYRGRVGAGRGRPTRLYSIAKRYQRWCKEKIQQRKPAKSAHEAAK